MNDEELKKNPSFISFYPSHHYQNLGLCPIFESRWLYLLATSKYSIATVM